MKVGLFGGSFNPIHNSHMKIVNDTLESKIVEEVWIIPCGQHAFGKNLLDSGHRVKMIEYAIKGRDDVKINRVELESEGVNYTIDSVQKLKRQFDHNFYLIVGADALLDLPKWKNGKKLMGMVDFLVFERGNYAVRDEIRNRVIYRESFFGTSSTEIRERIVRGESISGLVPIGVEKYIIKEGLYNG